MPDRIIVDWRVLWSGAPLVKKAHLAEGGPGNPRPAEPFPGVFVTTAEPHRGGLPDCERFVMRINGECAWCETHRLLKEAVDKAKGLRPLPSHEIIRILRDAKRARDLGDFARSYTLSRRALARLEGATP